MAASTGPDGSAVMGARSSDDGLPIRLLHDRVLVQVETEDGDRRSAGGAPGRYL